MKEYKNLGIAIIVFALMIGGSYAIKEIRANKELRAEEKLELAQKLEETEKKLQEFADREPQIIYKNNTTVVHDSAPLNKELSTSQIAKEWSPRVVNIYCVWSYSDGSLAGIGSGSGFITSFSNGIYGIITNRHVVLNEDKYRPDFCTSYLLNGEKYVSYWEDNVISYNNNYDIGNIIPSFSNTTKSLISERGSFCVNDVEIGDKIVVLGYPGIGSEKGITVTEGIISGIEDNYYVTSAKIDHGNSGGIAVSSIGNCIIGMPSAGVAGSMESLGRILKSSIILK